MSRYYPHLRKSSHSSIQTSPKISPRIKKQSVTNSEARSKFGDGHNKIGFKRVDSTLSMNDRKSSIASTITIDNRPFK